MRLGAGFATTTLPVGVASSTRAWRPRFASAQFPEVRRPSSAAKITAAANPAANTATVGYRDFLMRFSAMARLAEQLAFGHLSLELRARCDHQLRNRGNLGRSVDVV